MCFSIDHMLIIKTLQGKYGATRTVHNKRINNSRKLNLLSYLLQETQCVNFVLVVFSVACIVMEENLISG